MTTTSKSTVNHPAMSARVCGLTLGWSLILDIALQWICFIAGIGVNGLVFPTAVAAAAMLSVCHHDSLRQKIRGILPALAVIATAIIISAWLQDSTYDGNGYHQEEITLMLQGWNPYCGPEPSGISLWARHYAKAMEIISADIAATTGSIESGKAVNIILMASTAFLAYSFVRRHRPDMKRRYATIIALIAAGNPVCICQAPTFLIDFAKSCLMAIMLMEIADIFSGDRSWRRSAFVTGIAMLASLSKFNFFFETGLLFAIAVIWAMLRHNRDTAGRLTAIGLSAAALTILTGFHPYLTNIMSGGHPLYPLLGDGAVDIMTRQQGNFGSNRFADFALSLLSVNLMPRAGDIAGGLTIFMPAALAASAAALARTPTTRPTTWLVAALIVGSCFIYPQSWWARYICQLWLVVPLSLMSCFGRERKPRLATAIAMTCALLAMTNAGVSTAARSIIFAHYRHAIYRATDGREIRVANTMNRAIRHFEERGTKVKAVDAADLDSTRTILFSGVASIHDTRGMFIEIPAETYDLFSEDINGPLQQYYTDRRLTK